MMNKKIAAALGLALMLTACGNNENTAPDMSVTESETVTETSAESETSSETVSEMSEETVTESETVSETEQETAEGNLSEDYKAPYTEILMQRLSSQDPDASFELFDIDSDGTPELIISNGSAHMSTADIYTISDGKAVRLENSTSHDMVFEDGGFGSNGEVSVSEKGYILCHVNGTGTDISEYYSLKDGKLTKLLDAQHNEWPEEAGYEYGINGNEVSEAEYNDAVAEFEDIDWTTAGRKYALDNDAIKSVLGNDVNSEPQADYKDAYKAKLLEVMYDENATSPSFDLFDMDNDGIPELFMSIGDYHAAGVFAYTFKNGALVNLSADDYAFGSYGEAAVSADGYLTGEYMGMGMTYDYFYKLEGDKLVLKKSIVSEEFPDPTDDDPYHFSLKYKVNDEDATEEEYKSALAEYDAHDWVTVGRGTLISVANIDSVLYAE